MPICHKCNSTFPNRIFIKNKFRNLQHRKFCTLCSPFGLHNTMNLLEANHSIGSFNKKDYYLQHKQESIRRVSERRRNIKIKLVKIYGGKCILCDYSKKIQVISFHHIDPNIKTKSISDITNLEKAIEEAKRCIPVCCNCHTEIHFGLYPQYLLNPSRHDRQIASSKQYLKNRARREFVKRQAIEYKGGSCKNCGYKKCDAALTFHHINSSEKEINIGGSSCYIGFKTLQPELDKCDLLCRNCHSELHVNY